MRDYSKTLAVALPVLAALALSCLQHPRGFYLDIGNFTPVPMPYSDKAAKAVSVATAELAARGCDTLKLGLIYFIEDTVSYYMVFDTEDWLEKVRFDGGVEMQVSKKDLSIMGVRDDMGCSTRRKASP